MNHPMLTEIADIHDALSLWRRLVSVAIGSPLPPGVAVDAFRRLHGGGEPGAFDSALLLCTDWQWRRASAKVIAGIVDSAILNDDDQDALADTLLWQEQVHFRYPIWWTGSTFVEYELGSPGPGRTTRLDPNTPATAHRSVWPPLRNWAAGRVLMRHRASADDVLERARSLPARDAAAVVTGAVRAVDDLDPDQANTVLTEALAWGHKGTTQRGPGKVARQRRARSSADGGGQRSRRLNPPLGVRTTPRQTDTGQPVRLTRLCRVRRERARAAGCRWDPPDSDAIAFWA